MGTGTQGCGDAKRIARACAGKGDGDKAQRVALQIAFWVGPGQDPEYLEWLLSELMK